MFCNYLFLPFLLFLSVLANQLTAQALQPSWISTIGGNQFEVNNSLAQAPCGDIYTVGFFQEQFGGLQSFGQDREDGFISKYNDQGILQWVQQLHGSSTDRINGIAVTSNHEIYIVGEFRNTLYYNTDSLVSNGRLDIFIAKLDSSGRFEWARNAGGSQDDSAQDIDVLSNGNLVITGSFQFELIWGTDSLQTTTSKDVFVACINPNGQPIWANFMSGPSVDESNSIATDTSNGLYIMGSFRDYLYPNGNTVRAEGGVDAFLAKYDGTTGQLLWYDIMGGPIDDAGQYVTVDAAQNVIAGGWTDTYLAVQRSRTFITGQREEDAFMVKYKPSGELIWAKVAGGTFDERVYALASDKQENIYMMGTLDSLLVIHGDSLRNRHLNRPTDIFILKYDSSGTYKWGQTLGHYYNDICYDILLPNSQTLYLAGSYQDTSIFVNDTLISAFGYDVFLGKFELDTNLSIPIRPAPASKLNAHLSPNPSSNYSLLTAELLKSTKLSITICNVLGEIVYHEVTGILPSGKQEIRLSRKGWAAGTYFVKVQSTDKVIVIPWVLK